jgi:Derlin-2/3
MHIMFLGPPLVSVLVYVWGRRNPDVELTFLGLFSFKAPFLPWFFMAFGFAAHGQVPKDEICGVIIGHSEFSFFFFAFSLNSLNVRYLSRKLMESIVWYHFNDVYPPKNADHRPLDPPDWWMRVWEGRRRDEVDEVQIVEPEGVEVVPLEGGEQ